MVDEYHFERPYTHNSTIKCGRRIYVELDKDLAAVHDFLEGTESVENVVNRFASRSVSQIEVLKHNIWAKGTLYASLDFEAKPAFVGRSWWRAGLQYATTGVLLGPIGFDVWLLDQVMTHLASEMD
jgi:hypothetical protein